MAWGGGWRGLLLLLLLVLNNFCCSWIENLKGKARWGGEKSHLLPRSIGQSLLEYSSVGYDPSPAGSHQSPRQGWEKAGMCVPPSTRKPRQNVPDFSSGHRNPSVLFSSGQVGWLCLHPSSAHPGLGSAHFSQQRKPKGPRI